jgi:archaellum component FlaC
MIERNPTDTVQLKLRLREELRSRLEEAAKLSARSLNTEIVSRLTDSFVAEEQSKYFSSLQERLNVIETNYKSIINNVDDVKKKIEDRHLDLKDLSTLLADVLNIYEAVYNRDISNILSDAKSSIVFMEIFMIEMVRNRDILNEIYNIGKSSENPLFRRVAAALCEAAIKTIEIKHNQAEKLRPKLGELDDGLPDIGREPH